MPLFGIANLDENILLKLEADISLEEKALILASHMDEAIKRGDPNGGGLLQVENFYDINSAYQQAMNFLNILPELTGIVIWIGDQSATWDKLYDHLRRLNRIWIPKKFIRRSLVKELAKSAPTVYGNFNQEYLDFVLFRHSDANVLAQMLPSLEPIKKNALLEGFKKCVFVQVILGDKKL
ncbi:hypothetical protein [Bartonella sp. HY038]|uniref:hypothetical protein n=1 Tax=Bartonella sp. HY038 TaxID=2759660 RepID=UPI0015FA8679|nr:hypothetical protein [Bartonella sp. HY038]